MDSPKPLLVREREALALRFHFKDPDLLSMPPEDRAFLIRKVNYGGTITQESVNALSHLFAFTLSLPAGAYMVLKSFQEYGVSLLTLIAFVFSAALSGSMLASSLHHGIGLRAGSWHLYRRLRELDHLFVHILSSSVILAFLAPHFPSVPSVLCAVTSTALILPGAAVEQLLLFNVDDSRTKSNGDWLIPNAVFAVLDAFCATTTGVVGFLSGLCLDENGFTDQAILFLIGFVLLLSGTTFYVLESPVLIEGHIGGHEIFHVFVVAGSIACWCGVMSGYKLL